MQRDISNPRWVAVVETRRVVLEIRRSVFTVSSTHPSDQRNVLIGNALARHLAAVVGFIVAEGKDPDMSAYAIELRQLVGQGAYPFPPLLPELPAYEDLLPR